MCLVDTKMLAAYAKKAVADHPDSDVEIAMSFLEKVLPRFIGESNDRLVKVGRSVKSLVDLSIHVEEGLENLVNECEYILSGTVKVPTRPFGKTGLNMPIVTLGCMRFQQEWGPRITNMNMVGSDCQDNLVGILRQALQYGINHFETARGYGCSELQMGVAMKQIFATTEYTRKDILLQTKVAPFEDAGEFRLTLETSFKNLQVDYLDLFSFHGMNLPEHYDWVFGGENNCMSVVREYMEAGKIRHLGFSTHGATDLIIKCIDTDVFEYVNLHYHYFGSYTASGGRDGNGNLDAVNRCAEKNMGVFIISPYDKGGRMYAPSRKLRSLTLPDMEPMEFASQWLWNHHLLYEGRPMIHTFTVGAARPSDLDQPAVAASLLDNKPAETFSSVKRTTGRLDKAKEDILGKEWIQSWWNGLPKFDRNTHCVEHNQIVWLYNMIKAFGLYDFAKNRYTTFINNGKKWDDSRSPEENIDNIGRKGWGFTPGIPLKPDIDYSEDFRDVPDANKDRVREAEAFVAQWCSPKAKTESPSDENDEKKDDDNEKVPKEWETAYDMRVWPDYPDQPSRT